MSNKLYILGIGPGDKALICPAAEKLIEQSDVIIGGKRNLQLYSHLSAEKLVIGNNLEEISEYITENINAKNISVLASGDPGIFSIMEYLKNRLKDVDIEVIPGISSFQYLCSFLKLSWHDAVIASLHGREQDNLINLIRNNKKVFIFAGGTSSPQGICRKLIENDLSGVTVTVGENLSYDEERIITGKPVDIVNLNFESLSILLVQNESAETETDGVWPFTTAGIPDELFIRGQVPMTKEEVRAVTLSKLRLKENQILYDIGAGTGSVSIECGLKIKGGKVFAVEKEEDALQLIAMNIEKFGLNNIQIVAGEAPSILKGLPAPDRVFIGGTCGKIEAILEWIKDFGKPVRVVANAVAIESSYELIKGFEGSGFTDIDVTCLSVSRGRVAGGKHLMQALNPIYIISGEYGGMK
jgi:precorrin-6B C5,15-methyltransferase / cobalt-precorrin-6B C5,C15-methyltransferase